MRLSLLAALAVLRCPAAAGAASRGPTVPAALDALLAAGAIDQLHHDAWAQDYDDVKRTLKKLHHVRRRQPDAVLSNTRAPAAGGLLTPQRAPLVFETLGRFRRWWASSPPLRYQPGHESDLGYHKLVRDLLRGPCERVPDPVIYCTEADKFTAYLRRPPVLALNSTSARLKKPSKVSFTLTKAATVTVMLLRKGRPVLTRSARFGDGRHAFAFRPRKRGALAVHLHAVDLAGNAGAVAGRIAVRVR